MPLGKRIRSALTGSPTTAMSSLTLLEPVWLNEEDHYERHGPPLRRDSERQAS
jgi:hypothetical protein